MTSFKNICAGFSLTAGVILGTSALVIWPISYFERWPADTLITLMLALAFSLLTIGCHYFDCIEKRKRMN